MLELVSIEGDSGGACDAAAVFSALLALSSSLCQGFFFDS